MPVTARHLARAAALRQRLRLGRTETVVLLAASAGTTGWLVTDVVWTDRHDANPGAAVTYAPLAGYSGRTTGGGTSWDASIELDAAVTVAADVRHVARATSLGGIGANTPRYVIVDVLRIGLGPGGMRTHLRLRRQNAP